VAPRPQQAPVGGQKPSSLAAPRRYRTPFPWRRWPALSVWPAGADSSQPVAGDTRGPAASWDWSRASGNQRRSSRCGGGRAPDVAGADWHPQKEECRMTDEDKQRIICVANRFRPPKQLRPEWSQCRCDARTSGRHQQAEATTAARAVFPDSCGASGRAADELARFWPEIARSWREG